MSLFYLLIMYSHFQHSFYLVRKHMCAYVIMRDLIATLCIIVHNITPIFYTHIFLSSFLL